MCPWWVLDGWIWWFSSWILISIDFLLWMCHLFPTIQFSEVFASCPCWILLLHFSFHLSSVMSHQCLFPRFLFQIALPYVLTYHLPVYFSLVASLGIFRVSIAYLVKARIPLLLVAALSLLVIRHWSLSLVVFHLFSAWLTWELWQIWELGVVKKLCQCVLSSDAIRPVMLEWMFGGCMLQRKCSRPSRLPQHTETSQALQSSSQEMKDVQIFSRFA